MGGGSRDSPSARACCTPPQRADAERIPRGGGQAWLSVGPPTPRWHPFVCIALFDEGGVGFNCPAVLSPLGMRSSVSSVDGWCAVGAWPGIFSPPWASTGRVFLLALFGLCRLAIAVDHSPFHDHVAALKGFGGADRWCLPAAQERGQAEAAGVDHRGTSHWGVGSSS